VIGVVAKTKERARLLAEGLGLEGRREPGRYGDAIALGLNASNPQARGISFNAVLVDAASWPLSDRAMQDLAPTLFQTGGKFYVLREVEL
jgi:hypothetical protein